MPIDQYQLELAPTELRGPYGEAWATAFGLMKDGMVEAAILAVKCRWASTAPEDALAYIANERSLEQAPNETAADFRLRIGDAWNAWEPWGGTKKGIIDALSVLDITATIVESFGWDATPDVWANFWLFISQTHPFSYAWHVGDGTMVGQSGQRIGLAPYDLFSALVRAVRTWRPAHAFMVSCDVIMNGAIVGDIGNGWWFVGDGTIIGADIYSAHF